MQSSNTKKLITKYFFNFECSVGFFKGNLSQVWLYYFKKLQIDYIYLEMPELFTVSFFLT